MIDRIRFFIRVPFYEWHHPPGQMVVLSVSDMEARRPGSMEPGPSSCWRSAIVPHAACHAARGDARLQFFDL
jgi:hypothetical protein